jgi:hypothetical protein
LPYKNALSRSPVSTEAGLSASCLVAFLFDSFLDLRNNLEWARLKRLLAGVEESASR